MKKVLAVIGIVFLLCAVALAWTFTASVIPVTEEIEVTVPPARPPEGMKLSAVPAGKMFSTAALAYRGGSFSDERVFVSGAIVVQHPQGTLLFDAGFGSSVAAHVQTNPWLARRLIRYETESTVAAQLAAAGISLQSLKAVVLTHAHWDHVSGLEDLQGVPVLINQAERDFVLGGADAAVLARQLGTSGYQLYEFKGGPYLGFDTSHDVFGDGSVVLVPTPGHTPGSIVAFITLPSSQRYALVGDLVWQREGIELPTERPWLARSRVDVDDAAVRRWIVHMHQLRKAIPNLIVVPAHDRRVWEQLPALTPQPAS